MMRGRETIGPFLLGRVGLALSIVALSRERQTGRSTFVIGVLARARLLWAARSVTNMTTCNEIADYEWLTGAEAASLAAELAASQQPLHRVLAQLRRRLSPGRAHLVVELVELRRRAAAKFAAAQRMFFTRTALEQATDQWLAAYKAARFAAHGPIADLCCGIGGDLLALASRAVVVGVDRDPIVALLAAANARAVLAPDDAAHVSVRAEAVERFDLSGVAAWHVDPDRRPAGRRTSSPAWSSPEAAVIGRMLALAPHAAIKLAPAAKLPAGWTERCELEWISRGGECRQLAAWHGNLAHSPGQRRATILPATYSAACGLAPRTIVGPANESIPIASAPDRYVFDVDPSVTAAHLKGVLAAEHGLCALAAGATYLTGPAAIHDAALDGFEVIDVLPLRGPTLVKYFCERGIGELEIKKRNVDVEPEKLRRELKLRGDRSATLLVTPINGRATAIVGNRTVF
jgi:hypothetical protein